MFDLRVVCTLCCDSDIRLDAESGSGADCTSVPQSAEDAGESRIQRSRSSEEAGAACRVRRNARSRLSSLVHHMSRGAKLIAFCICRLDRMHASNFNSPEQKELHAMYVDQAVRVEAGDLEEVLQHAMVALTLGALQVQQAARDGQVSVVLGVLERPPARGFSVYASKVFIKSGATVFALLQCSVVLEDGTIPANAVHRKLMPTYEVNCSCCAS